MATKKLSDKLESFRTLIFNSRGDEIASHFNEMGVDGPYLDKGETLYNETMELVDQQKKEYQDQSLAFDQFYTQQDVAKNNYNKTLKLVRVLSRNDANLQDRLQLGADKVYAIEEWIEGALEFYNLLLREPDFLTRLARFKVTADQLKAEKEAVEKLRQLRNKVATEKGEAQEATRLRNEKLDELADYCTELRAISEIALEEQPQLLENLGILVRS